MANEKNARIINKHATPPEWEKVDDRFKPLAAEFIVYDDGDNTKVKLGDNNKTLAELPFITKGMVPEDKSLSYNADGTISLKQEYREYLDNQLYAYPKIEKFDIVGNNVEVGKTVDVSSFKHQESNTTNIIDLVLTSNQHSDLKLNVTPSESYIDVDFEHSYSYTFDTNKTLTYKLTLTYKTPDEKEHTISKTDSVSAYYPSFVGSSTSPSITSDDILSNKFTRVPSESLTGSINIPADSEYVYFVSTKEIKTIKSGVGDVSYEKKANVDVNINDVTKSYFVYRTNLMLTKELTYTISSIS